MHHDIYDSRVALLVLYGCETPLCCEEVADIFSRGPGKQGIEHAVAHLKRHLLTIFQSLHCLLGLYLGALLLATRFC